MKGLFDYPNVNRTENCSFFTSWIYLLLWHTGFKMIPTPRGILIYKSGIYVQPRILKWRKGLGSGPSLKMEGFRTAHHWKKTKKHGILELKITKKRTFLKRGSFVAARAKDVGSLGAAQTEKLRDFGRHCPNMGVPRLGLTRPFEICYISNFPITQGNWTEI